MNIAEDAASEDVCLDALFFHAGFHVHDAVFKTPRLQASPIQLKERPIASHRRTDGRAESTRDNENGSELSRVGNDV